MGKHAQYPGYPTRYPARPGCRNRDVVRPPSEREVTILPALEVIGLALWCGAANRAWHLWRDPGDLPLAALTAGLIAFAVGWTVGLPTPIRYTIDGLVYGLPKLVTDVMVMVTTLSLLAFFAYGVRRDDAVGYVRRQALVLASAVSMVAAAWALAPPMVRFAPNALTTIHDGHAFFIEFVSGFYNCYAFAVSLVWSLRYARDAHGALRRGLHILTVGLVGFLILDGTGLVIRVVGWWAPLGAPVLGYLLKVYLGGLIVGTLGFLAGLSYPALAATCVAIPVWWRRWATYRALAPLWTELNHAFPTLELSRNSGWRDGLRPWRVRRRVYRRVIEIRDGLVWLGPYYSPIDARNESAAAAAARVATALRAKVAGHAAVTASPPYPIPAPPLLSFEEDAAWLVGLSRAIVPLLAR
ncbi:MAG: MAB_1171c family putative transporter [Pseudonocardiaceae bacterium]